MDVMMPIDEFRSEWIAMKLKRPDCAVVLLNLIEKVREGEEDLSAFLQNCIEEGFSDDFLDTVVTAVLEPERYQEYLDLVLTKRGRS